MSRKQSYLTVLAVAICVILAGVLIPIQHVNILTQSVFAAMKDPKIWGTAIVCSFIFMGSNKYWLWIIACGAATALIIQFYFSKKSGISYDILLIRTLAFATVVYLLNLVKLLLNR